MTTPLEHDEQVAVVRWLRWKGILHFAVPNAAKRSYKLAAYLEAEGVQAGVPDLILPAQRIAIEMKRANAAPSAIRPDQQAWVDGLVAVGWRARVCRGAKEAIAWLTELGL